MIGPQRYCTSVREAVSRAAVMPRDDHVNATDPKNVSDRVTRAVAAAGAEPWLVGYDANAIQELIADTALPAAEGIPRGLAMRFDVREGATAWLAAGHTALGALL
jgi:hypothetical protein